MLSRQMGHSSIQITLDRYAHVLKEQEDEAANFMQDIFAGVA
jgi:integrase